MVIVLECLVGFLVFMFLGSIYDKFFPMTEYETRLIKGSDDEDNSFANGLMWADVGNDL